MTIQIIEHTDWQGNITEHVIIDNGNNEFVSMLKSTYDEMIAEQSTPNEL
jgi:N-acetylmuramoyl-L-alanine amidase CwlA